MQTLFLLCGFVARPAFHRRGAWSFLGDRARRILVPLVLAWLVMYPAGVFLWLLGASVHGNLVKVGIPPEYVDLPLWKLWIGFFVNLQFVKAFNLVHLWFLHQLLVLYVVVLALRAVWCRVLARRPAWQSWVDRAFAALCATSFFSVVLAIPTFLVLHMMVRPWKGLVVDTPAYSLIPYLPTTLLYGLFFVVGWMLQRQPELLERFGRNCWKYLLLGVLLVAPARLVGEGSPHLRSVHLGLYAAMMWSFAIGFLGLFVRYRRTPSATWRYLADASYWIYVVHWPLVILLQIWLCDVPIHWFLKFVIINVAVFPPMLLGYHYLMRPRQGAPR
jgi:peptidoglycan/LPS O-acetylase OafA/YrhL